MQIIYPAVINHSKKICDMTTTPKNILTTEPIITTPTSIRPPPDPDPDPRLKYRCPFARYHINLGDRYRVATLR
jgi:hypothetical protein